MAVSSSATLLKTPRRMRSPDAAEEALDLIEPRRRCWGEVHMETWMPLKPRLDLGVLVCGVIVGDQVHVEPLLGVAIDGAQEFKPFLMAMSLHALPDDAAGGDLEGGKQRCCSVTFVVLGHGASPPFFHRQAWLRAIKRLDLALLVDRKHQGFVRPIEIRPTTSLTLSTNRLSFDSLKVLTKCGFKPCAFQIRCTLVWLMPVALASVRALQCVAAGGF
jgi:hypothetical protein